MKGRKPKPAAVRALHGDTRDRGSLAHAQRTAGARGLEVLPAVEGAVPDPPAHLLAEGRREWKRLAPYLERARILTPQDWAVFSAYCDLVGQVAAMARRIKRDGLVIVGRGGRIAHPLLARAASVGARMRSLAAEFGLTPASRGQFPTLPQRSRVVARLRVGLVETTEDQL